MSDIVQLFTADEAVSRANFNQRLADINTNAAPASAGVTQAERDAWNGKADGDASKNALNSLKLGGKLPADFATSIQGEKSDKAIIDLGQLTQTQFDNANPEQNYTGWINNTVTGLPYLGFFSVLAFKYAQNYVTQIIKDLNSDATFLRYKSGNQPWIVNYLTSGNVPKISVSESAPLNSKQNDLWIW